MIGQGHRKFFDLPSRPAEADILDNTSSTEDKDVKEDKSNLLRYINDSVIGCDRIFGGPFGDRRGRCC